MKSQANSKEVHTKHSSREDSRKSSAAMVNNLIKKINRSIPLTIPTKSVLLNSQRSKPKVDPIKMPNQSQQISSHHSRYPSPLFRKLSINSTNGVVVSGRANHQNYESKEVVVKK